MLGPLSPTAIFAQGQVPLALLPFLLPPQPAAQGQMEDSVRPRVAQEGRNQGAGGQARMRLCAAGGLTAPGSRNQRRCNWIPWGIWPLRVEGCDQVAALW